MYDIFTRKHPGWSYLKTCALDFSALFFPLCCVVCKRLLSQSEKHLCFHCLADLPYTDFHLFHDNAFRRIFSGRVAIDTAWSLLYYTRGGRVQRIISQLKYKGNTPCGRMLARQLGRRIKTSPHFPDPDIIIPVPLHPQRFKLRGYNQSEILGLGLADELKIPVNTLSLVREISTQTQTRRGRFGRWLNVATAFGLRSADKLKNKHILLVDDVVTTGATLEACAGLLLSIDGLRLSMATLALTGSFSG